MPEQGNPSGGGEPDCLGRVHAGVPALPRCSSARPGGQNQARLQRAPRNCLLTSPGCHLRTPVQWLGDAEAELGQRAYSPRATVSLS